MSKSRAKKLLLVFMILFFSYRSLHTTSKLLLTVDLDIATNSVDLSDTIPNSSDVIKSGTAEVHTVADLSYPTKEVKVVSQHSAKWLVGPRLSNANVPDDLVSSLIMATSPLRFASESELILSQQSMCPTGSKFLHWQTQDEKEDMKIEDSLVTRLMYLAIHEHQHRPARTEASIRLKSTTNTLSNATDKVGNFDFACDPETKYIVNSVPQGQGFGYIFRRFGVEPMLLGLLTNRVSLSMHLKEGEPGPKNLKEKFQLSECKRGDMQCLFMPLSPCVLTHEDLENAVVLPKNEHRKLGKTGILNETYAKEKVLVVSSENHWITPKGVPEAFVDKITSLYDVTMRRLIDGGSSSKPWNLSETSLQKFKDRILGKENAQLVWSTTLLYALRPNQSLRGKINDVIEKSIPQDFDRNSAIGLPIRAGDKCNKEMKCLEFHQYMQMAHEMALKRTKHRQNTTGLPYARTLTNYSNNMYNTIVLSSESKSVTNARFNYTQNSTSPYTFIVNDEDIGQGNGRPRQHKSLGMSDQVMISTLSAFKMQMMPETLIVNMCSNSHKMMHMFYFGCGRKEDGYIEDMNNNDNEMFAYTCKINVGKKKPVK